MKQKFSGRLYEPLVWKADGIFKSSYTLYHDEQPIAHFRQESGIFKQDASIYLPEETHPLFIFRPKGIINTSVEVESNDIEFEAAKLKPLKWGGGITITFLNGNQYIWKSANIWGTQWLLKTTNGLKIAKLELRKWGARGTITVVSDDPAPAELNLLIFAGWAQYLFEAQAAAAAI